MPEARVLFGPGRGHRFEVPSRPVTHARQWASLTLGRYEPDVTGFIARRMRGSRVFFDVGAHTGYYTRVALRLMPPDASVVAFEPDPAAAGRLRAALIDPRLSVREEALGREDHLSVLERRPGVASRVRGESVAGERFERTETVAVRSLDGLAEAGCVPPPDIVKLDVEGGELLVLEGMRGLLRAQPTVVVECHSMPLLSDVLQLLIEYGYDHLEVTRGGDDVGPPTVFATCDTGAAAGQPASTSR